ncbi:MAG: ribosome silencing factor [Oscillospiraceae bacterium]|nr:ribosome silencing factor [Oscillospiraceae bacterium]MBR1845863.1 ribosome silencing factor [Oscillospiraceae bacterium]
MAEAKLLAEEIVKALDSKRAKEIEVLKVGDITILADYFILCTATSTTQIRTLADLCEETVEKLGEELHHREGERESGWVLLDFSTVVVHIFLPEQREFYGLDRLWRDGELVDISGLLEDAREQRKQELENNRL